MWKNIAQHSTSGIFRASIAKKYCQGTYRKWWTKIIIPWCCFFIKIVDMSQVRRWPLVNIAKWSIAAILWIHSTGITNRYIWIWGPLDISPGWTFNNCNRDSTFFIALLRSTSLKEYLVIHIMYWRKWWVVALGRSKDYCEQLAIIPIR